MSKIVSKVNNTRTQRILEEFEEQNKHGFDNRGGATHISAVFRWLDKEYKNELVNYGKRLTYEFMIPDPSVLHYKNAVAGFAAGSDKILPKPVDPRKSTGGLGSLTDASKITQANYKSWAALYNAIVSPPPAEKLLISKAYSKSQQQGDGDWSQNKAIIEDVSLPEGYGVFQVSASYAGSPLQNSVQGSIKLTVSDSYRRLFDFIHPERIILLKDDNSAEKQFDKFTESVPVAISFEHMWIGQVSVTFELNRKPELFEEWQLDTYNSIMSGYETSLQKYRDSVAQAEAQQSRILQANPAYYREIESTILRKNCIAYMVGHSNMGAKHTSGSTIGSFQVNNTKEMDLYASKVKFFEQAFEWNIMSYKFYPFYWAGIERWAEMYNYDNADSTFRDFMRAGMARVFVTVRPGFEEAVMFYMTTGQIWNGGNSPIINDPLYLSIVDELATPEGTTVDTWMTRVPSSLTIVQKDSITLDAAGLPCWCDSGTPPTESIVNDTESLGDLIVPQ